MKVIVDQTNPQSVFTRRILASLDVVRADMPDDTVSNVELLLLLDTAGDELTRTEVRGLARDALLGRREEVCAAAGQPVLDADDYAVLTDSFLSDMLTYALSDTLKIAIADAISAERRENLKQSFRQRMEQAVQHGLLSPLPQPPASAAATIGLALPRASAVLASVLAFAFCHWVALRTAEGATHPAQSIWASDRVSVPDGGAVTAVRDDVGDPALGQHLGQLDSPDPSVRASALDWLSSMGGRAKSVLPELRSRLGLQDPVLRWEAAWVLAYVSDGSAADVDALTQVLSDDNERVRSMAALALGRIGSPARGALPALQRSPVREAGLSADCIRTQSATACDLVQQALRGQNPLLRLMFERQLEKERGPMTTCMCSFAPVIG